MTRDQALAAARDAVEAVQRDAGEHAIPAALARARRQGWADVELVLLYADVLRARLRAEPDLMDRVEALRARARHAGDRTSEAVALGLRAEFGYLTEDTALQEESDSDLARATALLEDATDGPLTRVAGYVQCGIAYGQRDLWELEEQMHARAHAVAVELGLAYQSLIVQGNRGDAAVTIACAQAEAGRDAGLGGVLDAGTDALRAVADGAAPDFALQARVGLVLLAALTGQDAEDDPDALERAVAATPMGEPRMWLGWLHLARALRAGADRAATADSAARALDALAERPGSPPYLLALRLHAQAEAAGRVSGAALRYAEHGAALRWAARQRLLASARARLAAERLRADRDLQASYAQLDELTGLANRRGWTAALQTLRRRGQDAALAALFVDADRFKPVNDTYGHAVGDAVLQRIAAVLSAVTRPGDVTARLGGDEFAVLLPGADIATAQARAYDVVRALAAEPWDRLAPSLVVTVSVGVAAGGGEDPERLVARADAALYQAKAAGGGQVRVHAG